MADINIEAKSMAKAPVDPASAIPESVTKRAAAVAAYYDADGKRPHDVETNPEEPGFIRISEAPPDPPVTQQRTEAPVTPQAPPAAQHPRDTHNLQPTAPAPADQSPPADDESPEAWRRRYLRMQGQYNAAQKIVGEQEELMRQMGRELVQVQQRPPPQRQAPQQVSYLTERDVENYGTELIDLAQRAAAQVVAPQVQQIHEENARLREHLARESRRGLDQAVAMAVPNFREVDRDPRWHKWLLAVDLLSGRVRQTLLNEAISAADAPRVVSFFRGFLNEEAATGHIEPAPAPRQAAVAPREPALQLGSIAAPGRARPAGGGDASLPVERPIYSRADITRLYDQHRRGAYVGREVEWARQEADIIAAGREQRIR